MSDLDADNVSTCEGDCDDQDPLYSNLMDPECDGFYLLSNNITIVCPNALVGNTGIVNGIEYTKKEIGFH